MDINQHESAPNKGGGIGPVLIITIGLVAALVLLKLFIP